jgi:uncharacterized membrane protein YdjX (TVP38/TMEM64 family)
MSDQLSSPRGQNTRFIVLGLLVAVALVFTVFFQDVLSFGNFAQHRETLLAYRDAHYGITVAAFITLYIVIVAFSLPGATVATLVGGFLFGLFPGVVFNLVGATLGATGLFLAARWGLGEWLSAKFDGNTGRMKSIKEQIDENQWSMLFLIRLLPILPFFIANLLPALVNVPLHRFVISTGLGIIPGTFVFTSIGAGLGAVLARGEMPDLGIIFEPYVLLPLLGLAALSALPIVYKRFKASV